MSAESYANAAPNDYGEWGRFELADGRTIYVWSCPCCNGLCVQEEAPEGVEFAAPEREAVSTHSERTV